MLVFKIAAFSVISAILAVLMKQYRPEISMQIGIVSGLLILLAVVEQITGIIGTITDIAAGFGLETAYLNIVFKVIGISYIAQFAAQTCKDAGENAIAAKVELAAKILMLTLALPIVTSLLETVGGLLQQS